MRIDLARLVKPWRQLLMRRRRAQPWAVADLQPQRLLSVVVAPGRAGERPTVLQAAMTDFEAVRPDAGALAAFAQQLNAVRQQWSLLLPRDEYRLTVMPEPAVPADELAQSLRWQLAGTLDFGVEDATIDYLPIPTRAWEPERAPELYAVAARGDAVQAHAALFSEARLDLRAIDIRETAQRNIGALLERDGELLVLVAFCDEDVRISFNWQRELYMDRLIAEPAVHDDTPERRAAACERIQLQLQRSLDAVRANYAFMQQARIVIAGAPEGFVDTLGASLPHPVEALDPESLFDLSKSPQLREPRVFMRHFHALGAALRERGEAA